jgi:hypothetical protein
LLPFFRSCKRQHPWLRKTTKVHKECVISRFWNPNTCLNLMFLSHAHVGLIEHRIRYSIHWSVIHVLFNTHLCAINSISTITDFSPWCRIQDDLAGLTIQFATSLKICTCLNHRKSIHPIESMATRRPKSRVCRSGPAWMRCKWSSARRS